MTHNVSSKDQGLVQLTDRSIYSRGPRRFQNEPMVFHLERETGTTSTAAEDVRHVPAIDNKNISKPILILLHCLKKDVDSHLSELESSEENILDRYLVALFNVSPVLGIEEEALRREVRGVFL